MWAVFFNELGLLMGVCHLLNTLMPSGMLCDIWTLGLWGPWDITMGLASFAYSTIKATADRQD